MSVVRQQSIWNLIFNVLGVLLGALNKLYLYSEALSKIEFGVIELLLGIAIVGTEISALGSGKITLKFFPYFKERNERQGKFVGFVFVYTLVGFLALTLILLACKPWILQLYAENAPQFASRFLYLLPICLGYASYQISGTFAQSILKSVVPNFAFQVVMRLFHAAIILFYMTGGMDFDTLLLLYVLGYCLPGTIVLIYLIWLNKLAFSLDVNFWRSRTAKLIVVYGLFALMADTSLIILGKFDIIMIGRFLGEASAGAYGIALYMAILVLMPDRAITAILVPMLARKFREKDMVTIAKLYQKNATANLLVGGLIIMGIWANIDDFFAILPTFQEARMPAIILGLGFLANIGTGPGRSVIIISKYFRIDLYLNIIMMLVAIYANYILIPAYGLMGAAIATSASLILYKILSIGFIYYKFRMLPFEAKTWYALGCLILTLGLGFYFPNIGGELTRIMLRSASMTGIFVLGVYSLNILPEANMLVNSGIERIRMGK